jgi:Cof subfamily protein (haloacid dehalogenase superfamily)
MNNIDNNHYQLIVSDVDETLLNSKMQLGEFSTKVFRSLRDKGMKMTIATGKSMNAVTDLIGHLGIGIPMVFSNGGMVQDTDGNILYSRTLDKEIVKKILEICNRYQADWLIYHPDNIFVNEINSNTNFTMQYNEPFPVVIEDVEAQTSIMDDPTKVMVINFGHPEALLPVRNDLNTSLGDQTNIIFSLPTMLEIMPAGISKSYGVRYITDMLGVPLKHVIAFGDGDNDAEMLRDVGLGIAVQNASPLCKSNADMVVGSNEDQGPAVFLNDFYSLGFERPA